MSAVTGLGIFCAPPRRWWTALLIALLLHGLLLVRLPTSDLRSGAEGMSLTGQGADRMSQERVLDLRLSMPAVASGVSSAAPSAVPMTPQPVAGVDAEVATASAAGRAHYYAQLRAHLQHYRRVPEDGAQLRGTAVVSFGVAADGTVSAVRLVQSAGHSSLDAEALTLLRRAAPVPKPPQGRAMRLSVPIVFE